MKNKINNSHRVLYFPAIMIALAVVMLGTPVKAQIVDWTNTSNNNSYWPVGNNWSTFAAPSATDTARFNANETYEVWANSALGTIGYFQVVNGDVTFLNKVSAPQHRLDISGSGGSGAFSDFSISRGATTTIRGLHLTSHGGAEIIEGASLTLDGSHTAGAKLTVNGSTGFDISGNLDVLSGAIVSNTIGSIGRLSGSTGDATVNGTGSQWNNSSSLSVGSYGDGSLDVLGGGVVSNTTGYIGRYSSSDSAAMVSGSGSQWNNSSSLSVGYFGDGSLNVAGGGVVSNTTGYIGRYSSSIGTATVTGNTSQWNNSSNLYVGGSSSAGGTGTLDIDANGSVTVGGTTKLWSGGTINLDGGSLTTGSFDNSQLGTFNFNDGTFTVSGAGGSFDPGTANFLIDGNTSVAQPQLVIANAATANLTGNLFVGLSQDGTFVVETGGVVSNYHGYVGNGSSSIGNATVTGSGSQWNNSIGLYVGGYGDGSLVVAAGGVVSNQIGHIGNGPSSNGSATVTGSGSQWNNFSLSVGSHGNGSLNVAAGGIVSNTTGNIGRHTSATGTATVTGIGSQWNNSSNLYVGGSIVGARGTGTLNINDNGLVNVGGTTKIWSTGAVNLNGGRFEFGETTFAEFSSINAISGSMAGNLNHTGFTDVNSLTALQNIAVDLTDVTLTNSGALYGHAALGNALINTATGELQTTSGQQVRFAGAGNTNAGEINNFGGVVRFEQDMTNQSTGFVSGRGQFIANGGWTNEGVMAFSGGATDVLGDVENLSGGQIVTSGGGTTTFYDDVVHNGNEIRTAANSNSVFFGEVSGAGDFTGAGTVFFEGDLRPGNSPDVVSFEGDVVMGSSALVQFEIGGDEFGEFDQLGIGGDLFLDGELLVELIDGFKLSRNQEFLVADVGGALHGQFDAFEQGDLVGNYGGRDLFISYQAGDGNDVAFFTAVPEPGAFSICAFGLMAFATFYRRRKKA